MLYPKQATIKTSLSPDISTNFKTPLTTDITTDIKANINSKLKVNRDRYSDASQKTEAIIDVSYFIKDPGSAATHFIGAIAALVSAPFLLAHMASLGADALTMLGCCIFIISMILLYSASTIYHTVHVKGPASENLLKKFDHMMIFVLIAGTYTPVCLTILRGICGYLLLAGVWGFAILGMFFKFFWVACPKWVSSVIYIGMGWMVVFAMPQLLGRMAPAGFAWLLAGGIVYTLGGILYALKLSCFNNKHPYFGSHEIFHIFVMVGNILQFIAIYNYLIAK